VRVPSEAGNGNAKITLTFSDWKDGKIVPAQVEVPTKATEKDSKSK
jgi:hypothetical protein